MMAELAARNHEPITGDLVHLGSGVWCEDTAAAGELSTQGVVEADGKRGLFDQVIGQGWMVVGLDKDPAAVLTSAQLETLQILDGRTVKIATALSAGTGDAIDVDGTYAQWLSSIDACYFIIRPDFYIAATAENEVDLCRRLDEIFDKLHLR